MLSFDETEYNNPNKHYTSVKAFFDEEGNITPLSMSYEEREL